MYDVQQLEILRWCQLAGKVRILR